MREIKFRQPLRKKDGSFIEWFYWGIFISPAIQQNGLDTRKESQQFTGLKDKNGVDIYEGDIVSDGSTKGKVFYNSDSAQFQVDFMPYEDCPQEMSSQNNWATVIGNIYENLELLQDVN